MGIHDSSWTRVKPVFDALFAADSTGAEWLRKLLELPSRPDGKKSPLPTELGPLIKHRWAGHLDGEMRLEPPHSLLEYLLDHRIQRPPPNYGTNDPYKRDLREKLFGGDHEALSEARALIRSQGFERGGWHIFEGKTAVDAYLETPELIVLVEGKRTERGTTTRTAWMHARHQILRNLDAVWDRRGGKAAVAFFAVEGGGDPPAGCELTPHWRQLVAETLAPGAVQASLPHRPKEVQNAIANAFLGATTWQAICTELAVDWSSVRDLTHERTGRR